MLSFAKLPSQPKFSTAMRSFWLTSDSHALSPAQHGSFGPFRGLREISRKVKSLTKVQGSGLGHETRRFDNLIAAMEKNHACMIPNPFGRFKHEHDWSLPIF